jgi:nitroreductase
MDAIELLTRRASNGKLTEPAPDAESLRIAFEAAARAPDHANLRPWRMHIVRGAARERFGTLLADVMQRSKPNATEDERKQAAGKALRAPMIIVVSALVKPSPKAPPIEQLLTTGTAAHAVLMALQALGFAGIWRTGAAAYDPVVKNAFGLGEGDAIVGFLYVGSARQPPPELARPRPADFVSEWSGSS